MFNLFASRCPIGPRERVCVERGIARLVDVLGLEWVRSTPVLTLADLDEVLSVEPIAAAGIARQLAPQFPFPVDGMEWLEEPDIAGQIPAAYHPGDPPTAVVPQQPSQTPELRAALVARCLAEHALATRPEFGFLERRLPMAADLLSVLAGIGMFQANSTIQEKWEQGVVFYSWFHQRQLFIPSRLFGYSLALRCVLADESSSAWSNELRRDAREPFEQGLKFLRKGRPVSWDPSRDALRSFRNPPPVDDVVRRIRHRHAAEQIDALCDVVEFSLLEPKVQQEIGHLVHDPSDEVREEAIRAIVLMDEVSQELSPEAGEALILFCDDSTPRVRSLAATALGEVRRPPTDAVETLRMLTGDAEPIVNAAAAESLLGFPEGLEDDRPRLFRVLRQQLARCNYDSVDRFMRRLNGTVGDASRIIEQEFAGADDESWRNLLLESVAAAGGSANRG